MDKKHTTGLKISFEISGIFHLNSLTGIRFWSFFKGVKQRENKNEKTLIINRFYKTLVYQ